MDKTYQQIRQTLDDVPTKSEFWDIVGKIKLTSRQMEILELRFIDGLLLYEIGDKMGLSTKTVERDLRDCYRKIKKILEK
ncbi:sigma factor-like helix-turn-helix DNA-binding protein [Phascolarctobacterium sp.]